MKELSDRDTEVVALYSQGLTYDQIGKEIGICRQRACQIVQESGQHTPERLRAGLVPLTLRLPKDLYDRLLRAAKRNKRPIAVELREAVTAGLGDK